MIEQGELFPGDLPEPPGDDVGYRGPTACAAAGITYRQLDYWARTGLVVPSVRDATGSGSQRLYSFRDVLVLRVVRKLLEAGVSLQNIRSAVAHVRNRGVEELSELTLISDGSTVYECTSAIAVGRALQDMRGHLAQLPTERVGQPGGSQPAPSSGEDELSGRRQRRTPA